MGTALELFLLLVLGFASLRVGWPVPVAFVVGYLCLLSLRVTPVSRRTNFPTRFGFWAALFVGMWLLIGWGYTSVFASALDSRTFDTTYRFFFDGPALAPFWGYVIGGMVTLALFAAALLPAAALISRTMFGKYEQYEGHTRDATRSALGIMLGVDQGTWQVKNGKSEVIEKPNGRLARFGGPGKLIVQEGHAVILEKNGKVSRVVGSDLTWLQPFEMISMIVPLQTLTEQVTVSQVVTKDRIVIDDVEVFVFHVVDPGPEVQQIRDGQFFYNPDILCQKVWSVSGKDWRDAIKSITSRAVRDVAGRYNLEQIFPLADSNREMLNKELQQCVDKIAMQLGVKILAVDLGLIRIPAETQARLVDKWMADWDQRVHTVRAETDKLVQLSKATTRMETIQAIAEGLRQLLSTGTNTQDLIALRYIEYLEERATTVPPGNDTDTLVKLQGIEALQNIYRSGNGRKIRTTKRGDESPSG